MRRDVSAGEELAERTGVSGEVKKGDMGDRLLDDSMDVFSECPNRLGLNEGRLKLRADWEASNGEKDSGRTAGHEPLRRFA